MGAGRVENCFDFGDSVFDPCKEPKMMAKTASCGRKGTVVIYLPIISTSWWSFKLPSAGGSTLSYAAQFCSAVATILIGMMVRIERHHQHGQWKARIGRVAGNKGLHLGTFSTQEEVAKAIKFWVNFDITRYDVERIMESNTLLVGEVAR